MARSIVRRMATAGVAALTAGLALTACGSSGSGGGGETTVTYLTDYVTNGVYAPMWYGKQQGYFKDEGINLKIVYGTGSSTTVQQVAGGKADIGDAFSGVIAQGVAGGAPIKAVGFFRANGAFAFFCDKKLNITTYAQMKGHSVIIPPGTVQGALYKGALKAGGLAADNITVDGVASKTAGSVYSGGKADCITETLGDAPTFQKLRPSTVMLWSDNGFNMPGFAFFAKKDYLANHSKIVEGFLKATYRSIGASLDKPKDALDAFLKANPTAPKSLSSAQWDVSHTVFCTKPMAAKNLPIGYQIPDAWSTVVTAVQTYQGLSKSVVASSLFTNKYFDDDHVSKNTCTSDISS